MMTSKAHQKEKHTTKGKLWLKTRLVHQCFIDIHIVLHIVYSTKGQLISKCLFGVFNSPKKRTKKFDFTTMVPQVELFSFILWEN